MQYYKPELASTDPPLKSLADDKTPLPPPPHPRDIDVILAGFPWYAHLASSSMNTAHLGPPVSLTRD